MRTDTTKMNYVAEVADLFRSLNPDIMVLSPDDYLTIAEWEKQKIPLDIVLTVITTVCAQKEVDSLNCFKPEVKRNFEIRLREKGRE